MCGIIGYVGNRACKQLLLSGLEHLEYRGYDSAGLSLVDGDHEVELVRAVGNLAQLRDASELIDSTATTGVGHTRWATHGRPSEQNAHPLTGCDDRFSVVLNGIIENYVELKARLIDDGHVFSSQTDVEVVPHLIEHHYDGDLVEAVRRTYRELVGHFAFVVVSPLHPDLIVGARLQCPLVLGLGDDESFVASDVVAFLAQTRRIKQIEDGELIAITPDGVTLYDVDGGELERAESIVDWDEAAAEKSGYETFMLKEIHEQPEAMRETIGERLYGGRVRLELGGADDELLHGVERVSIAACGTAYHAGLVGRYLLEEWARVPVDIDVASETRYRNPVIQPNTLAIAVSQSGETADTIAAQRVARAGGARILAVSNVMGSQLTREADATLYTRCGREIGVAATKTFTGQVMAFTLLALRLAELRGTIEPDRLRLLIDDVARLPELARAYLADESPMWETANEIADAVYEKEFFVYIGRHLGMPVCLEGALKLKEISYIPTDAYPAGEMKHGPIALLSEDTPVVAVMNDSHVFDKVVSNVQEMRARGAKVIAVASEGSPAVREHAEWVLEIPKVAPELAPMLAILPLQVLAYRIAHLRGLPIDQPRNLAKTVTVE
ncbi:MAG: glutamine--fructose-6-phosphate transaminase (isomerizing) [Gaiellales bacterium]